VRPRSDSSSAYFTALISVAILGMVAVVAPCAAQTAEETVNYINGKIKGRTVTLPNDSTVRLDRVELQGSQFALFRTVETVLHQIGRSTEFEVSVVDLSNVQDFTLLQDIRRTRTVSLPLNAIVANAFGSGTA
jgi:hypothetical protein